VAGVSADSASLTPDGQLAGAQGTENDERDVDSHLRESVLASQEVYKGHFLHAFRDAVSMPNGDTAFREYVVHPGAVMVIPLIIGSDGQVQVVLERQFRYPVGRVMIEFPAGKLDPEETVLQCAQRELQEETGFTALEWCRVGMIHPVIAYSTEFIDIWAARGLTAGERRLDDGEFLDVFTATFDELLQWCLDGKVTDAKTISGVMWLQNVLSGRMKLDWAKAEGR
jgi:ADP-ribose pyrophosphatase